MDAIGRLRALVSKVREAPTDEAALAAWSRWIGRMPVDGADLAMHPDTLITLEGLKQRIPASRVDSAASVIKQRKREAKRGGDFTLKETDAEAEVAEHLETTATGEYKGHVSNVITILTMDSRWKGRLRWNEFAYETEIDGERLTDNDVTAVEKWLIDTYRCAPSDKTVYRAMTYVAEQDSYHPVRDYLYGLTWDGVERLDRLLPVYFGTEDTDLYRAMGKKWLVGCVARVMEPGVKLDTMPVLQGKQGDRKSTAIAALTGIEWFSDSQVDPQSKDLYGTIQGHWMYEVQEFDKWLGWREAPVIKAIVSSRVDKYRPPYAKCDVHRKRQTVFVGTVNPQTFLNDPTGSRRFWPIAIARTGPIDVEALERDRDQLWAEAHEEYAGGCIHWLTEAEEAQRAQLAEDHETEDPIAHKIIAYASANRDCTSEEIIKEVMGLDGVKVSKGHARHVAEVLSSNGFRQARPVIGGRRRRVWRPDEE